MYLDTGPWINALELAMCFSVKVAIIIYSGKYKCMDHYKQHVLYC